MVKWLIIYDSSKIHTILHYVSLLVKSWVNVKYHSVTQKVFFTKILETIQVGNINRKHNEIEKFSKVCENVSKSIIVLNYVSKWFFLILELINSSTILRVVPLGVTSRISKKLNNNHGLWNRSSKLKILSLNFGFFN